MRLTTALLGLWGAAVANGASLRGRHMALLWNAPSEPTGSYSGSKTVLGETVDARVVKTGEDMMSLTLSGVVNLSCDEEDYVFDAASGDITLLRIDEDGDCVHDALEEYDVTLDGIYWDAAADRITVTVRYERLKLSIDLEHEDPVGSLPSSGVSLAEAYRLRFEASLDAVPDGTYTGSTAVFGQSVDGSASFLSADGTLDFSVTGAISVVCEDEPYTYDGASEISLTDEDEAGDCLHDSLEAYSATIDEVTYDGASNSVTVVVSAFVPISLTLQHVDGVAVTGTETAR